jgi:hypothetical protein
MAPATAPTTGAQSQESAVRDLLGEFQAVYGRLDAAGAKKLWASVDERALARAFENLESQRLTLDGCRIQLGTTRALATCNGLTTYVGKLGGREQSRRSKWTFSLTKAGETWQIQTVEVR